MYGLKTKFFILIFFFSTAIYADSSADTLSQLLKNMRSVQANFTQTLQDKNGKALQKAKGLMSLQRPNQFRWEVNTPNKQLIVTNGKRLWIYDPDLQQVTIRTLSKAAGETPAMLLSDENLSLAKEFSVKPIKSTNQSQWFLLIPKDEANVISRLKIGFDHDQIKAMHLQDHLGHTTIIDFSNIKINKPMEARLFNFKPPSGVDIINESRA